MNLKAFLRLLISKINSLEKKMSISAYSSNPFLGSSSTLVGDLLTNPNSSNNGNGLYGNGAFGQGGYGGVGGYGSILDPSANQESLGLYYQKLATIDNIFGGTGDSIWYNPPLVSGGNFNNGNLFGQVSPIDVTGFGNLTNPVSPVQDFGNLPSVPGLYDIIGPQYNNNYQPVIIQPQSTDSNGNNGGSTGNNTGSGNNRGRTSASAYSSSGRTNTGGQNNLSHGNVRVDSNAGTDVVLNKRTGVVTLSQRVVDKINEIAQAVKCNPQDLMGVIYMESTFKTVPDNWNGKHAVGLIQWTDIAIKDLKLNCNVNYTKQDIANMSVMEQLDLAKITLLREKKVAGFADDHFLTAAELYAINYVPAGARRPNDVAHRGDGNYEGNEGLDTNRDGYITHSELDARVRKGRGLVAQA